MLKTIFLNHMVRSVPLIRSSLLSEFPALVRDLGGPLGEILQDSQLALEQIKRPNLLLPFHKQIRLLSNLRAKHQVRDLPQPKKDSSEMSVNLSLNFKESLKTALAIFIAIGIAFAMDWQRPYWAGFAVALLNHANNLCQITHVRNLGICFAPPPPQS